MLTCIGKSTQITARAPHAPAYFLTATVGLTVRLPSIPPTRRFVVAYAPRHRIFCERGTILSIFVCCLVYLSATPAFALDNATLASDGYCIGAITGTESNKTNGRLKASAALMIGVSGLSIGDSLY